MHVICITNNESFYNKYKNEYTVEYHEVSLRDIMVIVRNKVHEGCKILTHPLSGSIKPGETPYKTVIVEKGTALDMESLILIENCIITCDKFVPIDKSRYPDPEKSIRDFEAIDLSLAESALSSMNF